MLLCVVEVPVAPRRVLPAVRLSALAVNRSWRQVLEIDERGMAASVRVTSGTTGFHLSFDLDGIDPMVAPGVGTPVQVVWRTGRLTSSVRKRPARGSSSASRWWS
jgi:hypothetical protein